jgi:hypothetical protein
MITFQIITYFVHVLKLLRVTNTKSFNKSNKSNLIWTSKVLSQNIAPLALRLVSSNTFATERLFQLRETGYDTMHHMRYAGQPMQAIFPSQRAFVDVAVELDIFTYVTFHRYLIRTKSN